MPELKLGKLPDRKPVKITITVSAALDKKLHSYAEAYRAAYGEDEKVSNLIPFMLEQFLDGAQPAGQRDESVGQFAHQRLAFVHRMDHVQRA